jgi:hypothetical protein
MNVNPVRRRRTSRAKRRDQQCADGVLADSSDVRVINPGIVIPVWQACPHCGMKLMPAYTSWAHAAVALKSLTKITCALRRYPI